MARSEQKEAGALAKAEPQKERAIMKAHVYKLTAYPKTATTRDGTKVTLKPMGQQDAAALLDFFKRIPPEDRFYLKEDVTDPRILQRWAEELDYDRALPLLAWVDGRVVADGSLHRTRANARRHVGQVRIVVDPEYRSKGIGATMLHELAAIADENGLERIMLEAVAEKEDQAIKAAEFVGFVRVGLLPGHARDPDGRPRDIVILEMPLGKWFDWWDF